MKPILMVGSEIDFSNQKIIKNTNSGFIGIGINKISDLLVELYNKHFNERGIPYNPNMIEIKKNSYYERGKILRNLLISIRNHN
jgi:hypothetical protein